MVATGDDDEIEASCRPLLIHADNGPLAEHGMNASCSKQQDDGDLPWHADQRGQGRACKDGRWALGKQGATV